MLNHLLKQLFFWCFLNAGFEADFAKLVAAVLETRRVSFREMTAEVFR